MTIESDLQTFLETVVGTQAKVTGSNIDYTPKANQLWVRALLREREPERSLGLNPIITRGGLYAIDIFSSAGSGATATTTLAETIVNAFNAIPNIGNINILLAWSEQGIPDAGWYRTSVFVRWLS